MKIKLFVTCRKDKTYKNKTAPIHIRFTLNRQIRYVSTGISIPPSVLAQCNPINVRFEQVDMNYLRSFENAQIDEAMKNLV